MSDTSQRIGSVSAVKLAMLTRKMRSDIAGVELLNADPIAIIGMDCRFPGGANNPAAYWDLLRDQVDAIREAPTERWGEDAIRDLNTHSTNEEKPKQWGGFIDHVDQFDPYFFGISPREAISMDPQHRLLLEVAWAALEHAGQPQHKLAGSQTGVFVSIYQNDFSWHLGRAESLDAYTVSGNAHSLAVNRISYLLDLQGPSLAVDTACSSSLVALHLACNSLRNGECELALAGGVNLILVPASTEALVQWGMLAADGRCKTFDQRADGFVRGEGCGIVVLKRLANALADGDPILAVVRSTAVNQDGKTNVFTAPNGLSQQAVLKSALRNALLEPSEIGYVESHGTGTSLGDPIEVEAISEVYGEGRTTERPCVLGAVKTNIGHLEAAAGIAGLIKAVLCLQHEAIPANLHFTGLNPHIALDAGKFLIPTSLTPWPRSSVRRYAAVSSFGMGGTNAHAILEEAPQLPVKAPDATAPTAQMLPISAKSPQALRALAEAYATFLNSAAPAEIIDICATASARRAHHDQRLALVGSSPQEMAASLADWLRGQSHPAVFVGQQSTPRRPRLAFVFSGQGSQWIGMGRTLLERDQAFQTALDACAEALAPFVTWSPRAIISSDDAAALEDIAVIQPLLWAIQVALVAAWRARGIAPDLVIGHSMGEVAAATVAGILDLSTGAKIIAERSRLMRQLAGRGAMAVIELSIADATAALAPYADRLAIAVSNSPRSTVISGDQTALAELMARLGEQDIFCRQVKVTVASHSPEVDPICPSLREILGGMSASTAQIPMISTVTGAAVRGPELNAEYWVRNLREPVQFSAVVSAVAAQAPTVFVEVSPHPVVIPSIEQCLREQSLPGVAVASLRRDQDEWAALAGGLATLYVQGAPISWQALYPARQRVVHLPAYPWQRDRFWPESAKNPLRTNQRSGQRALGPNGHPLLGELRSLAHAPQTHIYEGLIDLDSVAYLNDHRVQGIVIFPAAGYIELCLAAATQLFGGEPCYLEDLTLARMLVLDPQNPPLVQVIVDQQGTDDPGIQIFSRVEGVKTWRLHAKATVRRGQQAAERQLDLPALQAEGQRSLTVAANYTAMADHGLEYGTAFRAITNLWTLPAAALGQLDLPEVALSSAAYHIHPVLLDSCFQLLAAAVATTPADDANTTFLPVGVDHVELYDRPGASAWGYVQMREPEPGAALPKADAFLFDDTGRPLFVARGMRIQALAAVTPSDAPYQALYAPHWEPQQLPAGPQGELAGLWLVFTNGSPAAQSICAQLTEHKAQPVLIVAGSRYAMLEPNLFEVDSAQPEDFQRLLADCQASAQPLRGIVYLWGLGGPDPSNATTAEIAAAQQHGVIGALHLVQALAQTTLPDPARLWMITAGAQQVEPGEPVEGVIQVPLWGMVRTLQFEQPDIRTALIDLSPAAGAADIQALLAELSGAGVEPQVALRASQRFVARLRRWQPEEPLDEYLYQAPPIHGDATYLIVGGLSGLGLAVAEWMAARGARHLVLLGRRAPSESARLVLDQLAQSGMQVVVEQADVSDAAALAAVFTTIDAALPPLKGVIHSAVVLDDGMLLHQNQERFRRVMAAKLDGSWNLHLQTCARELDFFVLFSSGASVLGSPGQSNYAAANAFQDGLAHYRQAQGLPATAINWGPWAEIGQAAAQENRGARLATQGVLSITPRQGLDIFGVLLQAQPAQVAVLPLELAVWQPLLTLPNQPPLLVDLVRQAAAGSAPPAALIHAARSFRAGLEGLQPDELRAHIDTYLRRQVAEVLRIPESRLDVQQPINSLGIDSLMALELKGRVEATTGVSLSAVRLLQGPTIGEMVDELAQALGAADVLPDATAVALPLVALQPHGGRPPFFCVHGAMGYAYGYAELARQLGPDQPVYGIEARGLDGQQAPFTNVEEMAAYYLAAIRTIQPTGPYLLGGASFGGVIAFEMACQLHSQGEEVALLAMMDSIKPSSENANSAEMDDLRVLIESAKFIGYFFGTSLTVDEQELQQLDPHAQIDVIVARYQAADSWPAFMDGDRTRSFLNVFRAILQANKTFTPRSYPGTITFFAASEGLPEGLMPPEFPEGELASAWEGCSTNPLVIYNVPGDHVTMVKEPHIRTLADLLRREIDAGLGLSEE